MPKATAVFDADDSRLSGALARINGRMLALQSRIAKFAAAIQPSQQHHLQSKRRRGGDHVAIVRVKRGASGHLLPMGRLSGNQECFYQLAFAADDHAREAFEPFAFGNFGIGVEPGGEGHDVRPWDLPFTGTGQEVLEQGVGQPGTANLGHVSGDRKTLG